MMDRRMIESRIARGCRATRPSSSDLLTSLHLIFTIFQFINYLPASRLASAPAKAPCHSPRLLEEASHVRSQTRLRNPRSTIDLLGRARFAAGRGYRMGKERS